MHFDSTSINVVGMTAKVTTRLPSSVKARLPFSTRLPSLFIVGILQCRSKADHLEIDGVSDQTVEEESNLG